jgi:hypothetical protein
VVNGPARRRNGHAELSMTAMSRSGLLWPCSSHWRSDRVSLYLQDRGTVDYRRRPRVHTFAGLAGLQGSHWVDTGSMAVLYELNTGPRENVGNRVHGSCRRCDKRSTVCG